MSKILKSALIAIAVASPILTHAAAAATPSKAATAPAATTADAGKVNTAEDSFNQKVSYALGVQLGMQLSQALKDTSMHLSADAVLQGAKEGFAKDPGYTRSYVAGMQNGLQGAGLQKEGIIKINQASWEKAFHDGLTGDTSKLEISTAELQQVMQSLEQKVRQFQTAKIEELKKKNLTEGATFLATNKSKAGVITTASGLEYTIAKAGTGPKIALGDSIKLHYTGKLLDGTTFDSSVDRKTPFEFVLNEGGLIKGWIELLQNLSVGEKVTAWIPEALAYGDQGSAPVIGPNATLQFDIEIISVNKPATKPAANKPPLKK